MSNRDDLLSLLAGRGAERIPFIFMGFNDEKTMHKLAPAECYDENTYYIPADDPARDAFAAEPRTRESRERAIAFHSERCFASYMDYTNARDRASLRRLYMLPAR